MSGFEFVPPALEVANEAVRSSGLIPSKNERIVNSRMEFVRTRKNFEHHEAELLELCRAPYQGLLAHGDGDRGFLYGPNWVLHEPMTLDRISLAFDPVPQVPTANLDKLYEYWPREDDGKRIESYSDAIGRFDPPKGKGMWRNDPSYRLLDCARRDDGGFALTMGQMRYFDGIDSGEALKFEAARVHQRSKGRRVSGPFRTALANPLDLRGRTCACNVSTITLVRKTDGTATFFLQIREGGFGMQGKKGCMPAGEFQPSGPGVYGEDVGIWKSLMREYAEELLGKPEAQDNEVPIDYEHDADYKDLFAAEQSGGIRVRVMDMGLDPLSWKFGIWTVTVFDEDVFDELFKDMVRRTEEGVIMVRSAKRPGKAYGGMPFTRDKLEEFRHDKELTQGARLCLALAQRHHAALGIEVRER